MILILGYEGYEQCTDPVIDWLNHYRAGFLKLTQEDLTGNRHRLQVDPGENDLVCGKTSLAGEVNVVWFRRFFGKLNVRGEADSALHREIHTLFTYLVDVLKDKTWLPPYQRRELNKLSVLNLARRLGMQVPRTRVLNCKKALLEFYREAPAGLITKPLHHAHYVHTGGHTYMSFTKRLMSCDLDSLPDVFFPSLFQEYIPAICEIRVFYLDGDLFPAGITRRNPERKISDIKRSRMAGNTRYSPYRLKPEEKRRLHNLMQALKLNTGSIDLLQGEQGLILLEVNPAGQFLYESVQCNWHLEKKIAEWLIKNDHV